VVAAPGQASSDPEGQPPPSASPLAQRDGLIILDVIDNGRGVGTPARSSGLTSMRGRAERNGGTFQLVTRGSGGHRHATPRLRFPIRQCRSA